MYSYVLYNNIEKSSFNADSAYLFYTYYSPSEDVHLEFFILIR